MDDARSWRGNRRPFSWSVLFIAVALLALAAVPFWLGQRINAVDREISLVLEPSRTLASDLATTYARQMSRFQEYLLTGSLEARGRYEALLAVEGEQLSALEALVDSLPAGSRGLVLPVQSLAINWQVEHRDALESVESREAFLPGLPADLERYERVLQALAELQGALLDESSRAKARRDRIGGLQSQLTILLVLMALGATLVVARLARGQARAVEEATRRREDAVRARREIDAVLEATAEAVLGLDLEGRVISLNNSGGRLLGFTEEDARGRPVQEVLHPGDSEDGDAGSPSARVIRDALSAGSGVNRADGRIYPRRGAPVEVQWSLRPLVDGVRARGAVLTLTDMRAVRAAERALRQAVRAREETMAIVGHDLRSPLSSIAAAAELLLDVPLPEDRRRAQLVSIQSAADRMNTLIRDLLDLARIDSGGFSVNAIPTRLPQLLDRALQMEAPKAEQARVTLVRCWPDELPPVVADDHRVLQVLGNLMGNALRYTEAGGRIEVGATVSDGGVVVRVRDSGSGIAAEDIPHLWDPFWQPDGDRTARREGAGLGLAIVKGIVEAHGGRVTVESALGVGSTFAFSLPCHRLGVAGRPSTAAGL